MFVMDLPKLSAQACSIVSRGFLIQTEVEDERGNTISGTGTTDRT